MSSAQWQQWSLADINAATKNLNAEELDITHLVTFIEGETFSIQQRPELLKQAYARLLSLRNRYTEFVDVYGSIGGLSDELSETVKNLKMSIQPGLEFRLESCADALSVISSKLCEFDGQSELVACTKELQAMVLAIQQQYQSAAVLYEQASEINGLSTELKWKYLKEHAVTLTDHGEKYGDKESLEQAINSLEGEVLSLVPAEQFPKEWADTQQALGTVCGILGQRQGGTRNLENAIHAYEAAITKHDRQLHPLLWAESQNSLGNALGILGHRMGDEPMLRKCIQAFEASLEERTPVRALQERLSTQNNLAAVLQSVGQRNKDTKMLKRSVEIYKEVLQQWTRAKTPLAWATTMNNLGTALRVLGEYRKGPRTLEQSIAAYKNSLLERTRDKLPQEWAMTQNNLGAALQKFADREGNIETLKKAINAYENALEEWTREKNPMVWGMTLANLAVARRTFAEQTEDIKSAEKAVGELEAVGDVFRHASHAQYSELSIDQLAKARKLVDALS